MVCMDIADNRSSAWVTGWASFVPGTVIECSGQKLYLRTQEGYVCLFDDYWVNSDPGMGRALQWRAVPCTLVVG